MAMLTLKNKKTGQSLVEVLVSLSILIIVFTATTTLMLNITNLTFSSRNRTEAIALSDQYFAITMVCIKQGNPNCNVTNQVVGKYTVNVQAPIALDATEVNNSLQLSSTNFEKAYIEVKWRDKNSTSDTFLKVVKVVRK